MRSSPVAGNVPLISSRGKIRRREHDGPGVLAIELLDDFTQRRPIEDQQALGPGRRCGDVWIGQLDGTVARDDGLFSRRDEHLAVASSARATVILAYGERPDGRKTGDLFDRIGRRRECRLHGDFTLNNGDDSTRGSVVDIELGADRSYAYSVALDDKGARRILRNLNSTCPSRRSTLRSVLVYATRNLERASMVTVEPSERLTVLCSPTVVVYRPRCAWNQVASPTVARSSAAAKARGLILLPMPRRCGAASDPGESGSLKGTTLFSPCASWMRVSMSSDCPPWRCGAPCQNATIPR